MANGLSVLIDETGAVAHAFAAEPGSFYLIRPDQHVAARWREFDAKAVPHALDRALGKN
jgi:3-(3-hydroxy-phenyl)propionate hydroxylase